MKDYYLEAAKNGIHIRRDLFDKKNIEDYKITEDNCYVSIKYLNGTTQLEPLETTSIEELNQNQRSSLEEIKRKLLSEGRSQRNLYGGLVTLHITNIIIQLLNQNWIASMCWLTCASLYSLKIYQPYKLIKEINLISWIDDNKEAVNEVIKEEVEEKATYEKSSINRVLIYPKDLVPYPESMYEEGINLNNIDELSDKELRKLKRKVLSKKKGLK